ncbi:hypothetical protein CEUSTIGMA_g12118.t1 [Chlamydomonas eustigma]|uniref:Uncharacterized protein n=1 Tax=Chlamydomonas eustigma TaxID=1157962 RepID=A0A250XNV1_9CHLO|nr:hypothetical protein CEUSTIGMA_g12118.t1 [Chlamydomonas eustigma]|eukprot:GAX84696.1 hypothetical protein CEUSTIGMA_g12118.t1 [Chlamydomonas eustigma]
MTDEDVFGLEIDDELGLVPDGSHKSSSTSSREMDAHLLLEATKESNCEKQAVNAVSAAVHKAWSELKGHERSTFMLACAIFKNTGFNVNLRSGSGSADCRQLRHTFILVRHSGAVIVVDPYFRDQFQLGRQSDPEYISFLHHEVPEVFIGVPSILVATLQVVTRMMHEAMTRQGLPIPPWRQTAAIMSKWAPAKFKDQKIDASTWNLLDPGTQCTEPLIFLKPRGQNESSSRMQSTDVRCPRFKLPGFPPTLPQARAELRSQGNSVKPQSIVVGFSSPKLYSAVPPTARSLKAMDNALLCMAQPTKLQSGTVAHARQDNDEGGAGRTPQLSSSHNSLSVGSSSLFHLVVRSMSDRGDGNMSKHRAQMISTSRPFQDRVSEHGGHVQPQPTICKPSQQPEMASILPKPDESSCSTAVTACQPQPSVYKPLLDLLPTIRIVRWRGGS